MHRMRLRPIILLLMIAGCAGPMGQIHTDTSTSTVTSFDGSYRSTIHVSATAGAAKGTTWCETPPEAIIAVSNGQFSYPVPHPNAPAGMTPIFQAIIAQDGTFSGQAAGGTISGRLSGSHMEGNIDGQACLYAFTGDRM